MRCSANNWIASCTCICVLRGIEVSLFHIIGQHHSLHMLYEDGPRNSIFLRKNRKFCSMLHGCAIEKSTHTHKNTHVVRFNRRFSCTSSFSPVHSASSAFRSHLVPSRPDGDRRTDTNRLSVVRTFFWPISIEYPQFTRTKYHRQWNGHKCGRRLNPAIDENATYHFGCLLIFSRIERKNTTRL